MEELTEQKCVACRVGAPSVTAEEMKELQAAGAGVADRD